MTRPVPPPPPPLDLQAWRDRAVQFLVEGVVYLMTQQDATTAALTTLQTDVNALVTTINGFVQAVNTEVQDLETRLQSAGGLTPEQSQIVADMKTNVDNATAALQQAQAALPAIPPTA